MTYRAHTVQRATYPDPASVAYWQRPSVVCQCGAVFSDLVAPIHRARTGHRLVVEPAAVRVAA